MNYFRTILILSIIMLISNIAEGQIVLQIERFNNPIVEKYFLGQTLMYKNKTFPKEWYHQKIIEIKDKEQLIIFEDGFVAMKDIIAIRKPKPIMKAISTGLYVFGINWFFWGGVASLRDEYELGWDTVTIGGFALLGGWLFRKFYYKTTTLNARNRLRILDISWPEPTMK